MAEHKIRILVQADSQGLRALGRNVKDINKNFSNLTSTISRQKRFLDLSKQAKNVGLKLEEASNGMFRFRDAATGAYKSSSEFVRRNDALVSSQKKAAAASRKAMMASQQQGQQFDMNALSVMFFGMAVSRVFSRIKTVGIDTFMKVTQGSTLAGQGINALKANFELLKFAIGEALAQGLLPFIPRILEIVQKVTDWVSENKELVTSIVISGMAIGTLALLYGTLKLGLTGVIKTIGKLGGSLVTLGGKVKTNGVQALAPLGMTLLKVTIVALLAYLAFKTFSDFLEENPIAKSEIKSALSDLGDAFVGLFNAITGGNVADIGELGNALGTGLYVSVFSLMTVLTACIDTFTAFWQVMRFDFKGAFKTAGDGVDRFKARMEGYQQVMQEMSNSHAMKENAKRAEELGIAMSEIPTTTLDVGGGTVLDALGAVDNVATLGTDATTAATGLHALTKEASATGTSVRDDLLPSIDGTLDAFGNVASKISLLNDEIFPEYNDTTVPNVEDANADLIESNEDVTQSFKDMEDAVNSYKDSLLTLNTASGNSNAGLDDRDIRRQGGGGL